MCTKRSFSKKEADEALKAFDKRGRKKWRKEQRIYYCSVHNAWHLTSVSEDELKLYKPVKLTEPDKWQNLLNNGRKEENSSEPTDDSGLNAGDHA